jgi:hypothetical protein
MGTLNSLIKESPEIRPKASIPDETVPLGGRTPQVSYQYRVSLNYTKVDPSPEFSPLERMDQLYQTSDTGFIPKTPAGFEFTPPMSTDFVLTDSNKFYRSILETTQNSSPSPNEVYLTSGGMNHVYLTHTNSLPGHIVLGSEEHLKWVMENGVDVAVKKVFKKNDPDGLLQAARMRSRDDAFYQLADALSKSTSLDGKPFLRIAKSDLLSGTQEFITGPTVLELRRAEEILRYPNHTPPSYSTVKTKEEALKILEEAGFVRNGAADLDEVSRQISAVEVFYKETHAVARELGVQYFPDITLSNAYRKMPEGAVPKASQKKVDNKVPQPILMETRPERVRNYYQEQDLPPAPAPDPSPRPVVREEKKYGAIGFDFNHGKNVIWSSKEKMFVIIDI